MWPCLLICSLFYFEYPTKEEIKDIQRVNVLSAVNVEWSINQKVYINHRHSSNAINTSQLVEFQGEIRTVSRSQGPPYLDNKLKHIINR